MSNATLLETLVNSITWQLIALGLLVAALMIKFVSTWDWEPRPAHHAAKHGHPKTGAELTIELYEQARRHRRLH
jgi:hypothetical protein